MFTSIVIMAGKNYHKLKLKQTSAKLPAMYELNQYDSNCQKEELK